MQPKGENANELRRFKGPKVNIDHMMMGREGNVIDAKDGSGSDSGSNGAPQMITTDSEALKKVATPGSENHV
jgi:hypothetical protein